MEFEPKLADFGLARRGFGVGSCAVGHEAYRAPELCMAQSRNYSRRTHWCEKADVYSYGILLWELLHKQIPYSDRHDEVIKLVRRGVRPLFKPSSSSAPRIRREWVVLITRCWDEKPQERPTAAEVVQALDAMRGPFRRAKKGGHAGEPSSKRRRR